MQTDHLALPAEALHVSRTGKLLVLRQQGFFLPIERQRPVHVAEVVVGQLHLAHHDGPRHHDCLGAHRNSSRRRLAAQAQLPKPGKTWIAETSVVCGPTSVSGDRANCVNRQRAVRERGHLRHAVQLGAVRRERLANGRIVGNRLVEEHGQSGVAVRSVRRLTASPAPQANSRAPCRGKGRESITLGPRRAKRLPPRSTPRNTRIISSTRPQRIGSVSRLPPGTGSAAGLLLESPVAFQRSRWGRNEFVDGPSSSRTRAPDDDSPRAVVFRAVASHAASSRAKRMGECSASLYTVLNSNTHRQHGPGGRSTRRGPARRHGMRAARRSPGPTRFESVQGAVPGFLSARAPPALRASGTAAAILAIPSGMSDSSMAE